MPHPYKPYLPQIETFKRDQLADLDKAVNAFVTEQYVRTGHAPILKPFPGGCSVIYFIEAPVLAREPIKFVPSRQGIEWPADLNHNRDRYGGRY